MRYGREKTPRKLPFQKLVGLKTQNLLSRMNVLFYTITSKPGYTEGRKPNLRFRKQNLQEGGGGGGVTQVNLHSNKSCIGMLI